MLIECQECNNRISDKADRCPRCGADKDTYLGSGVVCSECQQPGHRAYGNCANCGAPSSFLVGAPSKPFAQTTTSVATDQPAQTKSSVDGLRSENLFVEKSDRGRSSAGLWARYCAKQIDFVWLFFPAAILTFYLFRMALPGLFVYETEEYVGPDVLFGFVTLIAIACCEAVVISLFGSTPGKSLAGISIRGESGQKLPFGKSLIRSLRAFAQGQGLGVPVLALFTHLAAYNAIEKEGVSGWDKACGVQYNSQAISLIQWICLAVLSIASLVLVISLAFIAGQGG
jgi:hypothetical protein